MNTSDLIDQQAALLNAIAEGQSVEQALAGQSDPAPTSVEPDPAPDNGA